MKRLACLFLGHRFVTTSMSFTGQVVACVRCKTTRRQRWRAVLRWRWK